MSVRPCLVCKNTDPGQLSRHHLIPRVIVKDLGITIQGRVRTIKLCRDSNGCKSHVDFHLGRESAAKEIRRRLDAADVNWMINVIGKDWVKETYPEK